MNKNPKKLMTEREEAKGRLRYASTHSKENLYVMLSSSDAGMTDDNVVQAREKYGENVLPHKNRNSLFHRLTGAFLNPFTLILIVLAIVSLIIDVILVPPGEQNYSTFTVILVTVFVSGMLRFVQETKSGKEAAAISKMVTNTATIRRQDDGQRERPFQDIVVGDIVVLSAGDMLPADVRILTSKDLFVSQSSLTGESAPVEKIARMLPESDKSLTDYENIAFMGSNVISGSGIGIVIAVGGDTLLGSIAKNLSMKPKKTTFDKNISSLSKMLLAFMAFMVPVVFLMNGFLKHDWLDAFLFAISIAVGLTPEMLPMIVTTCMARGSVRMSKKKVIIKNLNSIQDLGAMDVLCTDKTGTLTQDKVVLEYHRNFMGVEDPRVLRHAFLNSYYQTGLKNLVDLAIIARQTKESKTSIDYQALISRYQKVDEIPFDFERRRMSVVVKDETGKTQMITKGAMEEMLSISSFVDYNGEILPLTDEIRAMAEAKAQALYDRGMRVIAVAQKTNPPVAGVFSAADEKEMVLIGYLAFLDPPKDSAAQAVRAINGSGIAVKVLTGDNEKVTAYIASRVGIPHDHILLGSDIEKMSDDELQEKVEETPLFAKLSPEEKARIVLALKKNGHHVGYMGDGINDTPALKASDVGISVDTASDICKESAGIILLEKDLMVLESGIIEGRKTFVGMLKYIYMTVSSNFGNMFSVLTASAFLPFLPMRPIHLLLLNLLYDIASMGIPWDNVDEKALLTPSKWDIRTIVKFMIIFGPISSLFDIATYAVMYFMICPQIVGGAYSALTDNAAKLLFTATFQAGWFIESMTTQTLVVHIIRTEKIPFIQSHASWPVSLLTFGGIGLVMLIPFTPLGTILGFAPLPGIYWAYLAAFVLAYLLLMALAKYLFVKRYKRLY